MVVCVLAIKSAAGVAIVQQEICVFFILQVKGRCPLVAPDSAKEGPAGHALKYTD